jgi:hypothetical protein
LANFARGKNMPRLGNDPEHLQFFTRGRLNAPMLRHFAVVRVEPVFPWLVAIATDPRPGPFHRGQGRRTARARRSVPKPVRMAR